MAPLRIWTFSVAIFGTTLFCTSCAGNRATAIDAEGRPCGMVMAREGGYQDEPRACALPSAELVASRCATHDLVTSPNYNPTYDDEGNLIDGPPSPEYRVTGLRCRFTNREHNAASCRFELSRAEPAFEKRPPETRTARFEHRFTQDHGPTHHFYSVGWWAVDRCTAAKTVIGSADTP